MFVKLTLPDGHALHVNTQNIGHMRRTLKDHATMISLASSEVLMVDETPDEIMALLCDAEREQMVRWCNPSLLGEIDEDDEDDEEYEARQ